MSSYPRLQRLGEEMACSSSLTRGQEGWTGREGVSPHPSSMATLEGQPSPPVCMQEEVGRLGT